MTRLLQKGKQNSDQIAKRAADFDYSVITYTLLVVLGKNCIFSFLAS